MAQYGVRFQNILGSCSYVLEQLVSAGDKESILLSNIKPQKSLPDS
jgi:hypothetical protein